MMGFVAVNVKPSKRISCPLGISWPRSLDVTKALLLMIVSGVMLNG